MDNPPLSRWKIFNLPFFRLGANKNAPTETVPDVILLEKISKKRF